MLLISTQNLTHNSTKLPPIILFLNKNKNAVLIKRGLDIVVGQELLNSNGRLIVLKSLIKDKRYLLANINFMVLTRTQRQFDFTKICRQHYEKWILVVMTTL